MCLGAVQLLTSLKDLFMKSSPLDQQAARAAAKRLLQKANFSGGPLQSYEISQLLADTYQYLKIPFSPTARDIKTYAEVLDANKDGQVTLADLENLATQYLCGPGVLGNHPFDSNGQKQKFQSSAVSTTSFSNALASSQLHSHTHYGQSPQSYSQVQEASKTASLGGMRSKEAPSKGQQEYSQQTLKQLSATRSIFQQNANEYYGIRVERVPQLLSETYQRLGRKGYRPNQEDVRVWMKLCDGNGDGQVEYEEYEHFVVRSLERSGYQIYQ